MSDIDHFFKKNFQKKINTYANIANHDRTKNVPVVQKAFGCF